MIINKINGIKNVKPMGIEGIKIFSEIAKKHQLCVKNAAVNNDNS